MNKNDLLDDGSRWAMPGGRDDHEVFKHWGAVEIYQVVKHNVACSRVYMLKMSDGFWRQATKDLSPGYSLACGRTTVEAPDGQTAHMILRLGGLKRNLEDHEAMIASLRAEIAELESEIHERIK